MKHIACYERLNEKTQLSIRLHAKDFTDACKYSANEQIREEKFIIMTYLEALTDCDIITDDESNDLYEVMTEEGNREYNKRIQG